MARTISIKGVFAMTSGAILITGASSGIGKATALALAERGRRVIAAARRIDMLTALADDHPGIIPLELDVTDAASAAAAMVKLDEGGEVVDVLVNNAGYGRIGPVEDVPIEDARAQFETNLFGAIRMIQAVLPGMRQRGAGRIVNVSSVAGVVAFPFMGIYCASKFALEGLSDSLRLELAGFGINVVLVEPAAITSKFAGTSRRMVDRATTRTESYRALFRPDELQRASDARASSTDVAVGAMMRAVLDRRPPARIVAPIKAKQLIRMRRWLPVAAFDKALRRRAGLSHH